MAIIHTKATLKDIDTLTKIRIQVLRTVNKLDETIDMSTVEKETYTYFKETLKSESHIAYLVYDEEQLVGAGGVSFYKVMPAYDNPTGEKAYIMNMYTHSQYRRKGIAFKTLELLVKEARQKGVSHITLEATEMGKPIYEKFGFVDMINEMVLQ